MPVTATIYQSELDRLAGLINAWPDRETGGELWGFLTRSGSPVVSLVTGPGPRARHNHASFFQDLALLERRAALLFKFHGVYQVGNWHSHHALGLREPSQGDDETVRRSLPKLGWPTFLMGLGNVEGSRSASVGFYTYDASGQRFDTELTILTGASPLAPLHRTVPGWSTPTKGSVTCTVRPPRQAWFQQPAASRRLAQEIRGLQRLAARGWSEPQVRLRHGAVRVDIAAPHGALVTASLEPGFPSLPPRVCVDDVPRALAWRGDDRLADHLLRLSAGNSR